MEIRLDPELEKWIEEQVRAGHYPTAGEVVRDALWRLRTEDVDPEDARAAFRKEWKKYWTQSIAVNWWSPRTFALSCSGRAPQHY